MKKVVFIFIFVFNLALISMSQITISSSSFPTAGHIITEQQGTEFAGVTVGNAGTNLTWDLTNLLMDSQTKTGVVAASTLPGYSYFPTANLGFLSEDGNIEFYNASSSDVRVLGGWGDPLGTGYIAIKLNPYVKGLEFPSTYNTNFEGTYNYSITLPFTQQPPFDSIRVTASVNFVNTIDGWGTVSTPVFSNVQCLRQKVREITTQQTYVHYLVWVPAGSAVTDTSYTYRWLSNAFDYTLAQITTDSAGTITSTNWLVSYLPGYLNVAENKAENKEFKVFPNPANSETTITYSQLNQEGELQVYNALGQLVFTEKIAKGTTKSQLNVQSYKNGMYKVVLTEKGKLIGQESIIKY